MRFLLALRQIFVDDTDQLSSMRVCCVLVTVVVLGVWVWGNWRAGGYVALGLHETTLLGIVYGAKSWQARSEYGHGGFRNE